MVQACLALLAMTAAPGRYTKPTPIQAQALPAALSGRDVLVRSFLESCGTLSSSVHQPARMQALLNHPRVAWLVARQAFPD